MSDPSGQDRLQELEQRLAALQKERESLELQARKVAEANARAALHMATRNEQLERQSHALATALERAEDASRKKDEFVAKVSHELRTPLHGILGMMRCLVEGGIDDQQEEYVSIASDSATGLLELINDLLDFSRISSVGADLQVAEIDAWRVSEEVVRQLQAAAQGRDLSLEIDISADAPRTVMADAGRLRQVLINLVGNSLKFTERGFVRVRLTRGDDGGLVLAVEDSGHGFDPAQAERLFSPFEQADNSASRTHGGIGLGLAICRELVQAMGGTISADSEPGVGSVFTVDLPAECMAADDDVELAAFDDCALWLPDPAVHELVLDHLTHLGVRAHVCGSWAELEAAAVRLASHRTLVLGTTNDSEGGCQACGVMGRVATAPGGSTVVLLRPHSRMSCEQLAPLRVLATPLRPSDLRDLLLGRARTAAVGRLGLTARTRQMVPELEGLSVLLVEDNVVNQRVGRLILERLGCEVRVAGDGVACLKLVASKTPDVVLMDCQMPHMDGYETTRRIRASREAFSQAPIVALTAHASDEDRARCMDAGMDDYLPKPVDPDQLVEVLLRFRDGRPSASTRLAG